MYGGQAEAILVSLAHNEWEGVGEIPNAEWNTRMVGSWEQDGPHQKSVRAGLSKWAMVVPDIDTKRKYKRRIFSLEARFVLGAEVGLVLRNVDHLSQGQNFSTNHLIGAEGKGIEYVVPVSRSILQHDQPTPEMGRMQMNTNFRRAVNIILAFILNCQGLSGLIVWRNAQMHAEDLRLERMAGNRKRKRAPARPIYDQRERFHLATS
jgi:hypothetical protein